MNDIEVYWNDWVTREEEGDPFSFRVFKGKGKEKQQEEEEEEEEEQEEMQQEQEQEEQEQEQEDGKMQQQQQQQEEEDGEMQQEGREDGEDEEDWLKFEVKEGGLPVPPTPDFNIDGGIPLPCQCETPAIKTFCLQHLASGLSDSGKVFSALIELVDALEVSPVLTVQFQLYLILF